MALQLKAEKIMHEIMESGRGSLDSSEELIWTICELASQYWKDCVDDFCLQHLGDNGVIIFGSTNRIQWSPSLGFRCFELSCTPEFKEHFREVEGLNEDGCRESCKFIS